MITLACLTCRLALRLSGDDREMDYLVGIRSDWYPDRYPCPRSACEGKMVLTDTIASTDLENLEFHSLNAVEAFQALNGMGLPPERACNAEKVGEAMRGGTIVAMELQDLSGFNRTVLYSLTLDNGIRIYFGSSPEGAVVYRIAHPYSYVKELSDGAA
jgi:hypothetical protein